MPMYDRLRDRESSRAEPSGIPPTTICRARDPQRLSRCSHSVSSRFVTSPVSGARFSLDEGGRPLRADRLQTKALSLPSPGSSVVDKLVCPGRHRAAASIIAIASGGLASFLFGGGLKGFGVVHAFPDEVPRARRSSGSWSRPKGIACCADRAPVMATCCRRGPRRAARS